MRTDFLSCLRGSEPDQNRRIPHGRFLSCLRGSEPKKHRPSANARFLSCLRGSEQLRLRLHLFRVFLSCLRGSELDDTTAKALNFKKKPSKPKDNPYFYHPSKVIDFKRLFMEVRKRVKTRELSRLRSSHRPQRCPGLQFQAMRRAE